MSQLVEHFLNICVQKNLAVWSGVRGNLLKSYQTAVLYQWMWDPSMDWGKPRLELKITEQPEGERRKENWLHHLAKGPVFQLLRQHWQPCRDLFATFVHEGEVPGRLLMTGIGYSRSYSRSFLIDKTTYRGYPWYLGEFKLAELTATKITADKSKK